MKTREEIKDEMGRIRDLLVENNAKLEEIRCGLVDVETEIGREVKIEALKGRKLAVDEIGTGKFNSLDRQKGR